MVTAARRPEAGVATRTRCPPGRARRAAPTPPGQSSARTGRSSGRRPTRRRRRRPPRSSPPWRAPWCCAARRRSTPTRNGRSHRAPRRSSSCSWWRPAAGRRGTRRGAHRGEAGPRGLPGHIGGAAARGQVQAPDIVRRQLRTGNRSSRRRSTSRPRSGNAPLSRTSVTTAVNAPSGRREVADVEAECLSPAGRRLDEGALGVAVQWTPPPPPPPPPSPLLPPPPLPPPPLSPPAPRCPHHRCPHHRRPTLRCQDLPRRRPRPRWTPTKPARRPPAR